MTIRKKLIEVALPLEAINEASGREKSIRHGHPSTLHLWWARRPLAACRAVLFGQLVDDPSAWPDVFPGEEAQDRERQRLFGLIEELVQWENSTNDRVIGAARLEIARSIARGRKADGLADARDDAVLRVRPPTREPLAARDAQAVNTFLAEVAPPVHDPFAGGGSIPLEAQRLGLRAIATDLNPVAVLINKALIEIPPKFAGRPPVNPESRTKYLGAPASRRQEPESKGWFSRGYLPHFDAPDRIQMITFRLADSMPAHVIAGWQAELAQGADVELRKRIERYLDSGAGSGHLRDERIATLVEEALLHFDCERYRLIAWVVMPNHVHVLIECVEGYPLPGIVHSWKSYTAKKANELLGSSGDFWYREYFDRYIRNEEHLTAAIRYIHENPVKAGLVSRAEEWRWSSAGMWRGEEAGAGGTPALPGMWKGAQGLAEDVRYYGRWMRDEAFRRIGHLYPPVKVTKEMAGSAGVPPARHDLLPLVGQSLTVIAWLWARTVASPNPACGGAHVPLVSSFWLSKKPGKEAWVETVVDRATHQWRFEVRVGKPVDPKAVDAGTKTGRGTFRCVLSGDPITSDFIQDEGKAGRMSDRLMAVVAEGSRGRVYLSPLADHEGVARLALPPWTPDFALAKNSRDTRLYVYGMDTFAKLFTPRQVTALVAFSELIAEAQVRALDDARQAGLAVGEGVEDGGTAARAYSEAIGVYLAAGGSRSADYWSQLVGWHSGVKMEALRNTFSRQALPITWDFAEGNPFSESSGNWLNNLQWVVKAITELPTPVVRGTAQQCDAAGQDNAETRVVSSDPPYYDNVAYADLSDFFYVWLRRALHRSLPKLFRTMLVPKEAELVASPHRHGGGALAEAFFLDGMTKAIRQMKNVLVEGFPATIYYAFKQAESETEGVASSGWETFLGALMVAGMMVDGTWPLRTELGNRMNCLDANALASSIVLVCRKRPSDTPTVTRADFRRMWRMELPLALDTMMGRRIGAGGTPALPGIAPVDMAQASIGPGMAIFSRHAKVLEADGTPMTVRTALQLINQALDEYLTEQEGEFDGDTRFALTWFETRAYETGPFGEAETLAKARNVSVSGVADAGILSSAAGKVRLLRRDELPDDWNPETDKRLTVWEAAQHLIKRLETKGEQAAADLLAHLRTRAAPARDLAYRLYTTCERKGWAEEGRSYNGLVVSWPELEKLSAATRTTAPKQGELL